MGATPLFTAQDGDADGAWQTATGQPIDVYAWGSFGGGAAVIEASPDGTEAFELSLTEFSGKAEPVRINLSPGTQYRGKVKDTAGSTSINMTVISG